MGCLKKGEHVCKDLKFYFHPFLGHLERVGSKICSTFLNPYQCSCFLPFLIYGGGVVFEAARTADFDFSQWFARIVFSCYFLYPFDAMFENLILPANVPPIIASALFQVFLLY